MSIPKIFISYAHEDIGFQKELVKRLKPLKRKGEIVLWHDGVIMPGEEWEDAIRKHLAAADIIILLISADFIDSDYIYEVELPKIIEKKKNGEIYLIPIVVRNVTLEGTNIEMYQCLPQDEFRRLKPIIEWDEQQVDRVWMQVDKQIRAMIDKFKHPKEEKAPPMKSLELNTDSGNTIDLATTKRDLKQAVVRDLGTALAKLEAILSEDSSFSNTLTQLQSQYNQYKRDSRMGIVSHENATIRQNRLVYAFQSLVDDLEEEDLV